jgi:hypothetical protein
MSAPVSFPEISIAAITEPIIYRYFQRLNAGEFAETAGLFAEDGILIAPFEEGVRGRQAIANYLHEEAQGLTAFPSQGSLETLEDHSTLFKVNVRWQFQLTNLGEIAAVEVKLLASPQELINLRQFA